MLNFEEILKKKPFTLNDQQIEVVQECFESLDHEEKIGQLFCINTHNGFKGDLKEILSYKPGGVFLGLNLKRLQHRAAKYLQKNSKIPLLIAGDLEMGGLGGAINGTMFGTQMAVGATNNPDFAYKFGQVVGREGAAMGYNWTFSPVVDISYNFLNPIVNVRSFSDKPDLVLKMASEHIRGVQENGLAATVKHWPGDGMDSRNQHFVTSHNSLPVDEWQNSYGKIYRVLIENGVKSVMSAHIDFPAYVRHKNPDVMDSEIRPGSISHLLNQGLLREELGFNGVIVSDATGMVGLISHGKREDLVPKVISSGNDMFLFAHGREGDFNRMKNGYETGVITKDRLNNAVIRILGMKASLNLFEKQKKGNLVPPKRNLKVVGCDEHNQWARECAKHSITLVKDIQKLIPLESSNQKNVLLIRGGDFNVLTWKFARYMKKKGFKVKNFKKKHMKKLDDFDIAVYLVTLPAWYSKTNLRIDWREFGGMKWFAERLPTLFISMGSPYHLFDIPRVKTYINAYAPFPIIQEELVNCLVGDQPFLGKSPVDAFCGLFDAKL